MKGINKHPDGYLVRVGWKLRYLRAFVTTFEEAKELRLEFERRLRKPRTEKWIRGLVWNWKHR